MKTYIKSFDVNARKTVLNAICRAQKMFPGIDNFIDLIATDDVLKKVPITHYIPFENYEIWSSPVSNTGRYIIVFSADKFGSGKYKESYDTEECIIHEFVHVTQLLYAYSLDKLKVINAINDPDPTCFFENVYSNIYKNQTDFITENTSKDEKKMGLPMLMLGSYMFSSPDICGIEAMPMCIQTSLILKRYFSDGTKFQFSIPVAPDAKKAFYPYIKRLTEKYIKTINSIDTRQLINCIESKRKKQILPIEYEQLLE